jgi:hypothetical protein
LHTHVSNTANDTATLVQLRAQISHIPTQLHKTYTEVIFGHIFRHTLKLVTDTHEQSRRYSHSLTTTRSQSRTQSQLIAQSHIVTVTAKDSNDHIQNDRPFKF